MEWLWGVVTLMGATFTTGFFFLLKRTNQISDSIDVSQNTTAKLDTIIKEVSEMRDCLIGTYQKKGLVGKVEKIQEKVDEIDQIVNHKKEM